MMIIYDKEGNKLHECDGADLRGADLRGANLYGTDLRGADLHGADLHGADLRGADLRGANLHEADLRGVDLHNTIGNGQEIKTIQTSYYTINYTEDVMQIGCENHPIEDWWGFDDERINSMDKQALDWWMVWKPILQRIILTESKLLNRT